MLYPMVVVGSLSADVRRDCSRTAARRVRRSSSSPDEQRLAPHECVVLVVAGALVSPSMYLSHSLWELSRSGTTMTALMSAIVGLRYFMDFTVFSFSCQWFFYESATIKQVLHGFLVETGSLNSQETREIILAATSHIAVLVQAQATSF
ncbi:Protoporphyrin uptake protein 1 [Frankliniella fusca]|uniref:Protoporphyrin uptake protein 1 n=1 Tax=Frankliniella fusca TaxID=407009 RepID=A0AAE1HR91_9NEOP|nr:Protoporphyrin uptake protein 1 [Frankliniella fusca]